MDEVFVVRNEHEVVALVPVERQDFLHVTFMVELDQTSLQCLPAVGR